MTSHPKLPTKSHDYAKSINFSKSLHFTEFKLSCSFFSMHLQMTIDFLGLPVPLQEPPQHAHPPDPGDFDRHTRVCRTLTLPGTCVPALSAGDHILTDTSPGVHLDRFTDNQPILNKPPDILT